MKYGRQIGELLKRWKKANLFLRLSIGLIAILIGISVLLTVGFTFYYKRQADKSVYESVRQITDKNAQNISNALGQMEMAIATLNNENSGIQEKLLLYEGDTRSLLKSFYQTIDLLNNYLTIALRSATTQYHVYFFLDASYGIYDELSVAGIDSASLDGKAWIYSDELVCEEEWYQLAQEVPNHSHWLAREGKEELCIVRGLQYFAFVGDKIETVPLGIVMFRMDPGWIKDSMDTTELTSNSIFWLVDEYGNILYNSNPDAGTPEEGEWIAEEQNSNGMMKLNGKKYAVESREVALELDLVTLVPTAELQRNYIRSLWPFFVLLLIALSVGGGISVTMSRRMTRDILYLAQHMRKTKISSITPAYPIQDDDIGVLYDSYNTLVEQVQESIRRKMVHMEEKREMELNLMQAQINPHFLCNSLNSVYNVAVLHNEDAIAKAVQGLCAFLRYNVSAPNIEVPLRRELDMLENYVLLQNFLYGDKIFFDYDIQVDSEQTYIPKMLLQPLVENCIMHNSGNEFIEIGLTCSVENDRFCIVVEDNGSVNNTDAINRSLKETVGGDKLMAHGVGIRNVHQRIKIRYGDSYGLYYTVTEEGGVAARIELPISVAVFPSDDIL